MKRAFPYLALLGGIIALAVLLPLFDDAQPHGVRLTQEDAQRIADKAARDLQAPVDELWATTSWTISGILSEELKQDDRLERAWNDPVLGPRLGAYRVNYYREGKEKYPGYARVTVDGRNGQVIGARIMLRAEDQGEHAKEAELRARADAFVRSRTFGGAPSVTFEEARPSVQRHRTDWTFRYRVAPSAMAVQNVVHYLNVYFVGSRFAGFELQDEYADGRVWGGGNADDIAVSLVQFLTLFVLLLVLLVIFLRKYHAGEVGVGAASFLFAVLLLLGFASSFVGHRAMSEGIGMGSIDARTTSYAFIGFKTLLIEVPMALLVFLAWSVGESYARERWGERLASFESILRRDGRNATAGRSILIGLLAAPVVAAASLAVGAIPLAFDLAWPSMSDGAVYTFYLGGPAMLLIAAMSQAILIGTGALLFIPAWANSHRVLWLGILGAVAGGVIAGGVRPPVAPLTMQMLFGFGGVAACIAIFFATDLLAATTALFGGTLLTYALPTLLASDGALQRNLAITVAVPLVACLAVAIAGLATRREVVYSPEDLAPHVKRIIERERVKAEIDAANRIQAALLPLDTPNLAGAQVASHYRAATEIGGDYFDFLIQPTGEIGIAFGDVSGHGLTSGIVMSMAKAALLVQIDYDPSPRAVLDVLNDIVIRTAPKRILMTFFFGILDPRSQTLRFSSAGHLDPYVYRASTRRVQPLSSWGFPLGVKRREPFREHTVEFSAGDRLILYSDGLIEAVDDDGEPFGFERFERVIAEHGEKSADDIKKSLLTAVKRFTHNRPPEDDQTLVVVAFEEVTAGAMLARPITADVGDTVH